MIWPLNKIAARFKNAGVPSAYHRDDDPRLWNNLNGAIDKPLTFSAFWRGVNYLSGVVSAMPWTLQQMNNATGASVRMRGHVLDRMLSERPNPNMTAFTARQTMLAHRITHGAGYAEIQRDVGGRPIAYWPIQPDRVRNVLAPDRSLVYMVQNSNGQEVGILPENMLHFPGLGFDGVNSYSVIECARRTIRAGVAGDEFATALWENSAMIGGMVTHPETLSETAYDRLRAQFTDNYVGAAKRGRPLIGEEGLSFTPFAIPPEDAQFLENRQFTIEEMARWLGIPPHKMMDNRNATYSNVEEQNLEVIGDTIVPLIESLEQEVNYKLLGKQQRTTMFTQMDVAGLARGNFKARADWLRAGFDMGGISPDRVAREFGEAPTPGGENRFVQLNLQTVEQAAKPKAPPVQPVQHVAPPADDDANGDTDADDDNPLALSMLRLAAANVARFESAFCDRHGVKSDAYWIGAADGVKEKLIVRITDAVLAISAHNGTHATDALLVVAEWAVGEVARLSDEREPLNTERVADTLLDSLNKLKGLAA